MTMECFSAVPYLDLPLDLWREKGSFLFSRQNFFLPRAAACSSFRGHGCILRGRISLSKNVTRFKGWTYDIADDVDFLQMRRNIYAMARH